MDASKPFSTRRGKSHPPSPAVSKIPVTQAFLVTLAAREDMPPFGAMKAGSFAPNALGQTLEAGWKVLGENHPGLIADAFKVERNRFHGILLLDTSPGSLTLAVAVRLFKALSGRRLSEELAHWQPAGYGNTSVTQRGAIRAAQAWTPADTRKVEAGEDPPTPAWWKKTYVEKALTGTKEIAAARRALRGK